jgi:hypothetical protein
MEGHGDDSVDFARPAFSVLQHQRGEHRAKLTAAIVLEALNRIGDGATVLEDGAVAGKRFEEDGAGSTEGRSAVSQLFAASTASGGDETEEAFEEIVHGTVSVHCDRGCLGQ